MKALIEREVERRELADDIKLGPGGIREIEFIVQAFQLIRGGSDRALQTASLLRASCRCSRRAASAAASRRGAAKRRIVPAAAREPPADAGRRADASAAGGRLARARIGARDGRARLGGAARASSRRIARRSAAISLSRVRPGGARRRSRRSARRSRSFWMRRRKRVLAGLAIAGVRRCSGDHASLLLELRASALLRRLDEPGRRAPARAAAALLQPIVAVRAPASRAARACCSIIEAIGSARCTSRCCNENAAALRRLVELCAQRRFPRRPDRRASAAAR